MTFATPNITGFYNMSQYANTVTDGYFWLIMSISVAVIVFMITYFKDGGNPSTALAGGSFAFVLTTFFLDIMDLLPSVYFITGIVVLAISALLLVLSRDTVV